jgi:hypothetical protein
LSDYLDICDLFKFLTPPANNPIQLKWIYFGSNRKPVDQIMELNLTFRDTKGEFHRLNEIIEHPVCKRIVLSKNRTLNNIKFYLILQINIDADYKLNITAYYTHKHPVSKIISVINGFNEIINLHTPSIPTKSARKI